MLVIRKFFYGMLLISFAGSSAAHDSPITYDRVNLSMSAEAKVDTDLLIAVLYVQREGQRPAGVADEVNKRMRWAVDLSKSVNGVKVQTLQYSTSPVYKNRVITGWRAPQSLQLETAVPATLTDLVGKLQENL